MTKITLIFGITGQYGAYLADFLLGNGYMAHCIKRRALSFNTNSISHSYQTVTLFKELKT